MNIIGLIYMAVTHQDAQFYHVEFKRCYGDMFTNTNHPRVTKWGWNNNLLVRLGGGSVYYVSCYGFKNTTEEDNEMHNQAALQMVKKISTELQENGQNEDGVQFCAMESSTFYPRK